MQKHSITLTIKAPGLAMLCSDESGRRPVAFIARTNAVDARCDRPYIVMPIDDTNKELTQELRSIPIGSYAVVKEKVLDAFKNHDYHLAKPSKGKTHV